MRTITLELLRHGVAHNQLLSPLTPYLALCENHAAVTLNLPFEHNQFLHRLRALGYKLGEESRLFQLQDTARTLGNILASIPGLTAESNKCNSVPSQDNQLTHLRLIISASELALLPFELALTPAGMPGAGQNLLLQPQTPICLTREVRRVPGEVLQWPAKPRILFVAAQPPTVGPIPVDAHLLALRRAIAPWVQYLNVKEKDQKQRLERISEHLDFLPAASIEAIEAKCATGEYTHVHILAHGVEERVNYDSRFFLALHSANNPDEHDNVSGARLATALRAAQRCKGRELARPAVVTLASCNSGDVGSVAGAGASIAHALHDAGIPLVIASQFPLSFAGSVVMVDVLYEGLLCGEDPRLLLHDLRRRLHAQFPQTHDWSSLTAYASLPADIDGQLDKIKVKQAKRCIDAAISYLDAVIPKAYDEKAGWSEVSPGINPFQKCKPEEKIEYQQILADEVPKIEEAKRRLKRLLDRIPKESSEILGILASTEKRQAEVVYCAAWLKDERPDAKEHIAPAIELLLRARDLYWKAFLKNTDNSWGLVQYLSLAVVLKNLFEKYSRRLQPETENYTEQPDERLKELWTFAHILSRNQLKSTKPDEIHWAHGNLIELYLLALQLNVNLVAGENNNEKDKEEALKRARYHVDEFLSKADRDSFEVFSTQRQIKRYFTWYRDIAKLPEIESAARELYQRFSQEGK